jgi:hypothetical protein
MDWKGKRRVRKLGWTLFVKGFCRAKLTEVEVQTNEAGTFMFTLNTLEQNPCRPTMKSRV